MYFRVDDPLVTRFRTKWSVKGFKGVGRVVMSAASVADGDTVVLTGTLHGYQVIFSPYSSRKLAFVGAINYGLAGAT